MRRLICRILIALTAWAPWQMTQAGMIGTEQAAGEQQRAHVASVLERADVASGLQALGIEAQTARERVAAMTDEEVGALANRVDSLPAGAISNGGLLILVIIVAAAVWWGMGGRPHTQSGR